MPTRPATNKNLKLKELLLTLLVVYGNRPFSYSEYLAVICRNEFISLFNLRDISFALRSSNDVNYLEITLEINKEGLDFIKETNYENQNS